MFGGPDIRENNTSQGGYGSGFFLVLKQECEGLSPPGTKGAGKPICLSG